MTTQYYRIGNYHSIAVGVLTVAPELMERQDVKYLVDTIRGCELALEKVLKVYEEEDYDQI